MKTLTKVCVYCGSADHLHADYLTAAQEMGRLLAEKGLTLIYGAGKTGLMGAVADGALGAGGKVIGVIPENLNQPQLARLDLTEVEVCHTISERQARMLELADAMIALPGGFGTLYELFEALTWAQIGLHRKPIGVLNIHGYYDPLLDLLKGARTEGFIFPEHYNLLTEASTPAALLQKIQQYEPPAGLERWITRAEGDPPGQTA